MGQLREEIGIKKHLRMKLVRSKLLWARHIKRTNDDRLTKRTWENRIGCYTEGEEEDRNYDWRDIERTEKDSR